MAEGLAMGPGSPLNGGGVALVCASQPVPARQHVQVRRLSFAARALVSGCGRPVTDGPGRG